MPRRTVCCRCFRDTSDEPSAFRSSSKPELPRGGPRARSRRPRTFSCRRRSARSARAYARRRRPRRSWRPWRRSAEGERLLAEPRRGPAEESGGLQGRGQHSREKQESHWWSTQSSSAFWSAYLHYAPSNHTRMPWNTVINSQNIESVDFPICVDCRYHT